jgi:hypothetical protein
MDELSHDAERLLNASRIAEAPNEDTRQRIRASIAAATGLAAVTGTVVTTGIAAAGSGAVSSASGSATAAAVAGSAATTKVIVTASIASLIAFSGGALVGRALEPRDAPDATPVRAVAPATPRAEQPQPVPSPPHATPSEPPPAHVHAQTSSPPPVAKSPHPKAPLPPIPATSTPDARLGAELALIRAAHHVLGGDAARTLALVDAHLAQFPDGQLAQERESLRVRALCGLHRDDDARAAARTFFARWPSSPHASRLRASCAGDDE